MRFFKALRLSAFTAGWAALRVGLAFGRGVPAQSRCLDNNTGSST